MIFEWLKKNKGTPLFKFVVMLLILFLLRIGLTAYNFATGNIDEDKTDTSSKNIISELFNPKDENGEDEPLFDIHIGWSNIILFAGCGIALVIIEKKKDKGSEEQQTIRFSKNNDDEE